MSTPEAAAAALATHDPEVLAAAVQLARKRQQEEEEMKKHAAMQAAAFAAASRAAQVAHQQARAEAAAREEVWLENKRRQQQRERESQERKAAAASQEAVPMWLVMMIDMASHLKKGDKGLTDWYHHWREHYGHTEESPEQLCVDALKKLIPLKATSVSAVKSASALSKAMLVRAVGVTERDTEAIASSGAILRTLQYMATNGGAVMNIRLLPTAATFGVNSSMTGHVAKFRKASSLDPMTVCIPRFEYDPLSPSGFTSTVQGACSGSVDAFPSIVSLFALARGLGDGADFQAACASVVRPLASDSPAERARKAGYAGYGVQLVQKSPAGGKLFLCVASPALGSIGLRRKWVEALNAARDLGGKVHVGAGSRPFPPGRGTEAALLADMNLMTQPNAKAAKKEAENLAVAIAGAMGCTVHPEDPGASWTTVGNQWRNDHPDAPTVGVFFSGCAPVDGSARLVAWGGPALGPIVARKITGAAPVFSAIPSTSAFPLYANCMGGIRFHAAPLEEHMEEGPIPPPDVAPDSGEEDDDADLSLMASVVGRTAARAPVSQGIQYISCGGDVRPAAVMASQLLHKKLASWRATAVALAALGFEVEGGSAFQPYVPTDHTVVFC